jgi:plasmid maintenance system antidote protein VapI
MPICFSTKICVCGHVTNLAVCADIIKRLETDLEFVRKTVSKASVNWVAERLGKYFGTGSEFWINLQANYDLCVAAAKSQKEIDAIPQLAYA